MFLQTLDVIGVGQQILIVTWTADMPPDIGEQVPLKLLEAEQLGIT